MFSRSGGENEPLNLISEALTLIAAPGRRALNLESLHSFTVSDELQLTAQGGDLVHAYRPQSEMTEALEMKCMLTSPANIPVRNRANFLQERLSPPPSVMRKDETTPGLPEMSDEPGCENEETSKHYSGRNARCSQNNTKNPAHATHSSKGVTSIHPTVFVFMWVFDRL